MFVIKLPKEYPARQDVINKLSVVRKSNFGPRADNWPYVHIYLVDDNEEKAVWTMSSEQEDFIVIEPNFTNIWDALFEAALKTSQLVSESELIYLWRKKLYAHC